MNLLYPNETYKKIPWIYEMPNIFKNQIVSIERLDRLLEDDQKALVYRVISTLNEYFGQIPGHCDDEVIDKNINISDKFVKSISNILITWLSGLCDLTAAQIVNGLLDILNLKTEYTKWPPKSVMEFYAICKTNRAPYHNNYIKNCYPKIEFNNRNSEKVAFNNLCNIFKMQGRDYIKNLNKNIKNIEIKENKVERDFKRLESMKKMLAFNNYHEA